MSKVAVIGSNSFSGADFIDLLLEEGEYEVLGISRSPEKSELFLPYKQHNSNAFQFKQLDLNKDSDLTVEALDSFAPDYIVNFAAQSEVAPSWEYPEHWFETNVVALSKLLKQLRKRNYFKRYVHISSPEVYGACSGTVTETAALNPTTPYAASKAAADLMLFTLVKNFDFPLVMIRSTNVYGPHQQLWKIIPRSVIKIKLGEKIQLHGGGNAVKSYIHIRDISHGELDAMLKGKPGNIYHLSPDDGVSVRSVVQSICDLMGCKLQDAAVDVEERQGQDAAYVIDSTKARTEFGWSPKISIQQGLAQVVQWVERYFDQIGRESLEYVHKA